MNTIKLDIASDKKAYLSGRFDPSSIAIIRDMPGRKRWLKDGRLVFEVNPQTIGYLKSRLPDIVWGKVDPLKKYNELRAEAKLLQEQKLKPLDCERFHFEFKTQPMDHQRKAFNLSRDKELFALFMDMGTGKTKVIIDTAAYLFSEGKIDTLFVTAPNGVQVQWIQEQVPKHLPDYIPYEAISFKAKSLQSNAYKARLKEVLNCNPEKLRIITINFENFAQSAGVSFAEEVLLSGHCLWAIDESTRIKTPKAQRTKAILKLKDLAKYRRIMSGAPITQGVQDLYTQFEFLHKDILGFSSYYTFRNHYCNTLQVKNAPYGAVKITGYKNIAALKGTISGHSFRVTKEECLDLPEKLYMTKHVPLTSEQKKHYKQMKEELLMQLEDGTIVDTPNAMASLMKLQQVVCGGVLDNEGRRHKIKNNRIPATIEAIEDINGKVIVWARFRADHEMLCEAMEQAGITFVEYSGRVSAAQREQNKAAFKTSPDVKVLLAQQQSGGTGLNLEEASYAIYYSNDFNADTRWQSEDRIHRIGQKNTATYIDLVSPGTIDTKILAALRSKKNVAESVMGIRDMLKE